MEIDSVKMNKVLKSFRSSLTWETLRQAYQDYRPKYNASLINNANLEELQKFSEIFHFATSTLPQYKTELNRWLKSYPSFFADNTDEIISNIRNALEEFNRNSVHTYNYINWIPMYGGILKIPEKNAQIKWRRINGIPFTEDVAAPQTTQEESSESNLS